MFYSADNDVLNPPPPISQSLPARSGAPAPTSMGSFLFKRPGPVIIDLWSGSNAGDPYNLNSKPWNVVIQTTGGSGQGPALLLTSPGVSRVCLYGLSFQLTAYNLQSTVLGVAARAYRSEMIETSNVAEYDFTLPGGGSSLDLPIVPYAKTIMFDVPVGDRAAVTLTLLSPLGATMGQYSWAEQPPGGIPIGSASTLRITNGTGTARAVYTLQV